MKYKQLAIIAVVVLFISGCVEGQYVKPAESVTTFAVKIISEPSGAVIEVNNNYIGKTPLTVELEGWAATRTFTRSHAIVAHPVFEGGETQIKIFTGYYKPDVSRGNKIPKTIYMNMNLIKISE